MAAPAGWHSLPEDLQLAIVLQLSAYDRRLVASVCRRWEVAVRAQQQRLNEATLTGLEEPDDFAAMLSGVAKRRRQLENLSARIAKPEAWAPLALLLSRLDSTMLRQLEIYGDSCTGGVPTCLALHLRGLRRLYMDGLVGAPSDAFLGGLTTLTSLDLEGFTDDPEEPPSWPVLHLPESLTALRLQRRVSLRGSDRIVLSPHFKPLWEWMQLGNARVLGQLPALVSAEFTVFVVPDLDWLQGLHGVTRLSLGYLRWYAPGVQDDDDPPHFSTASFNSALQPLTRLRHLNMRLCGLTTLPGSVAALRRLQVLSLFEKSLDTLPCGPYQRSLEVLDLIDTPLRALRHAAPVLQGMPKLAVLGTWSLHTSELETVLMQLLPGLTALKALHLPRIAYAVRAAFPALTVPSEVPLIDDLPYEVDEAEEAAAPKVM